MSAFMCDDNHLKQLAAWLVSKNQRRGDADRLARLCGMPAQSPELDELASFIATILYRENERSLAARYGDEVSDEVLTVTLGEVFQIERADLAAIAKSAQCYRYQACETDDYDESMAERVIIQIEREVIRNLPGFEDANWGAPCQFDRPPAEVISLSSMMR